MWTQPCDEIQIKHFAGVKEELIANIPHTTIITNLTSFCHTNMGIPDAIQLQ